LIAAPCLAAVMSLTSDYNRHPDEIHHFEATRYYIDHFLPPEIGDPSVRDSYSVWGVSYLNYHWLEYFLAGKFTALTSPFFGNELIAARFFNVLLLYVVALFFLFRAREDEDILLIPSLLLVTPQIWYVFSYVNNDAFPLAITFLLAYQAAYPKSALSRFLNSDGPSTLVASAVGVAALIGFVLISKTNYYAFLFFLVLFLLYKFPIVAIANRSLRFDFVRLRKYALILCAAVSVLGFRCALDFYVNGETNFVAVSYVNYIAGNFEKKESRLMKYQEEIAEPPFKPSTIERDLGSTYPLLRLKDKGVTYLDTFRRFGWHSMSFKSFVGVYGYMNIYGPKSYYIVMGVLYAAIAVYLFGIALLRGQREILVQTILLTAGVLLCLFASSYLSWSYAFQAQGRYLFPLLPMTAAFVFGLKDMISKRVFSLLVGACFLLSVYSFVFVGVLRVNSPPPETSEQVTRSLYGSVVEDQGG
jgi:hypothetical protein